MKVIAIKQGYFGKLREPDEVFEVPDGEKATWFVPADKSAAADKPGKKTKEPADDKSADKSAAA